MTVDENGVALVTLNRSEKRNAINASMINDMIELMSRINHEKNIGCVVITGGPVFSAGRDLKEIQGAKESSLSLNRQEYRILKKLYQSFEECQVPIIVAIKGYALGLGAGLVTWCDMAIMGETAKYGFPEAELGVLPGVSSLGVKKWVPKKVSYELLILGKILNANEAQHYALVNRVVRDDEVLPAALSIAKSLTQHGSDKSRLMKQYHQNLFSERTTLEMEYSLEMMALSGELSKKI